MAIRTLAASPWTIDTASLQRQVFKHPTTGQTILWISGTATNADGGTRYIEFKEPASRALTDELAKTEAKLLADWT